MPPTILAVDDECDITAWTTNDARNLGLELGALDYITKPFSSKNLNERVNRLLGPRLAPA